ncbi:MAG: hypothetical protein JWP63_5548 [Candidatus Solibacter sp.]|nr:hypothetical protein [Candidatus Solibacter sp.]
MAHPIVKRWTTEETIVSAVPDAKLKGTLVTLRTRALEGIQREPPESRLLVRDNCIYVFDGSDAELRGLCFPMAAGKTWGRVPTTSPAQEYVWRVRAVNADPYGVPQVNTFHLSAHESS